MGSLSTLLELDDLLADGAGQGVRIGLIDGPVDSTHPDLAELDLRDLGGGRGCIVPASPGCGHGTFVAGILGARPEGQVPGICPASTLLVRPIFCEAPDFGQCPLVTIRELATAVRESVDAGAQILNLSLGLSGGEADPTPLYDAYDYARDRGALVVVAAGNQEGEAGSSTASPLLLHPWPIGVAAASSGGRAVAEIAPEIADRVLLAPGVEVAGIAPAGDYRTLSGASAATPFVTGTLALLRGLYPQADAAQLRAAVLAEGEPGPRPRLLDGEGSRRRLRLMIDAGAIEATNRENLPMTEPFQSDRQEVGAEPANQAAAPAAAPPSEPRALPPADLAPAVPAAVQPRADGAYTDFVYAIGTVKAAFPARDVEKEYQRVAKALSPPVNPTDLYSVLHSKEGRFLADYMCWVLSIGNVDTYILKPRSPAVMDDLIEALNVTSGMDPPYATLIGPLGPPAPPGLCRGLQVPMVLVNQAYHFYYKEFVDQIVQQLQAQGIDAASAQTSVQSVLQAMEMKPNPGASDRDRALNYIAYRYPEIYKRTAQMCDPGRPDGDYYLKSIAAKPSGLQGSRRVVDVIFDYQNLATQEESDWYCSVDVTGQFPFLNSALRPFIPSPSE